MAEQIEASGPSLSDMRQQHRSTQLHHLRIFAAEGGTPESPAWEIAHHAGDGEGDPAEIHQFRNGEEMISHIRKHAHVPEAREEGE
jgi:hypothetical protein